MLRLKLVLALILVALLPLASMAFDFGVVDDVQSICASDTLVYIVPVKNTDNKADSYTVSLSGEASKWAVAVPAGFVLQPGESKSVYIYVTPSPKAQVGTYNLDVLVNSGLNGKQSKTLQVVVNDCHSATLSAEPATIQACACTPQEYKLVLENTGRYTENFAIILSGSGARYAAATLSEAKLAPKEKKEFTVNINTACNAVGNFDIVVSAVSKDSNAVASVQLNLESRACYDFDAVPDKTYLSFCENSEAKIPITVENNGVVDNSFLLEVRGPKWVTLEKTRLDVLAGKSEFANLILFPGFGIAGDFKISLKLSGEKGQNVVTKEITANVLQCHSTDLKIAAVEDVVCPFTSKAYEISLANTGKFDEEYAITAVGADFAAVDKGFVKLKSGESQKFNLVISPKDVPANGYAVKVLAESQGPSRTSASDLLKIKVAPKEACFGVQATAAQTKVYVAYGEGALIPIAVENKGREASIYNLEVSGSGANYAELNPGTLTLKGAEAQTVYLYVAIPVDAQQADYKVTVAARLKDGTVSSSSTINFIVVKELNRTITGAAVVGVTKFKGSENFRNRFETLGANLRQRVGELRNAAKISSISEVKEVVKNYLPKIKAKIKSVEIKKPDIKKIEMPKVGLKKLELPKVEIPKLPKIELLKQVSDVRNKISNYNSNLGGKVSGILGKIATRLAPVTGVKAQVYTFLKKEMYGQPNWMIAGTVLLVLVILFGFYAAFPKKESKGTLVKFWDWLEEEEEVTPDAGGPKPEIPTSSAQHPAESGSQKGWFQRFMNWLEEEDEVEAPKTEADAKPVQQAKPEEKPEKAKSAKAKVGTTKSVTRKKLK